MPPSPLGFNAQGLAMGMQIAGPAHADLGVLAIARAYESLTHWTMQRPPPALA